jgi:hypothetical protein
MVCPRSSNIFLAEKCQRTSLTTSFAHQHLDISTPQHNVSTSCFGLFKFSKKTLMFHKNKRTKINKKANFSDILVSKVLLEIRSLIKCGFFDFWEDCHTFWRIREQSVDCVHMMLDYSLFRWSYML